MKRNAYLLVCAACLLLTPACGWLLEMGREVVAEVGDERIRVRDLQSRIRELDFQERSKAADKNAKIRIETRRRVLDKMVADRLMVLEAQSRGFEVTEEEILQSLGDPGETHDEAIDEVGGGAPGRVHEEAEERSAWELEEARNKLLVERLLKEELSEDILRRFYDEHVADFKLDSPLVNYEIMSAPPGKEAAVDTVYTMITKFGAPLRGAYETIAKPDDKVSIGITPTMPLDRLPPSLRENVKGLGKRGALTPPFYFGEGGQKQYAIAVLLRVIWTTPYEAGGREKVFERVQLALIQRLKEEFEVSYYEDKLDYRVEG